MEELRVKKIGKSITLENTNYPKPLPMKNFSKITSSLKYIELIQLILRKMPDITKWQLEFILHNFELQCQLRGRHNFLNMARYGGKNECTYRSNYHTEFDFATFNLHLISEYLGSNKAVAFDPSYISKSGKCTPGGSYFWSGCAGTTQYGLEIGGFAAVDVDQNTALHYLADQTLSFEEHGTLLNYYAALVERRAIDILKVSKYLLVDAFFSREPFVTRAFNAGLEVISRLRDDADLHYLYVGPHPKRRGRKTKYAGKFDARELNMSYFTCCLRQINEVKKENYALYEATLYSKALKRNIRVVVQHNFRADGSIKNHKIFFSTDTTISGIDIFLFYKSRFQIEFLYRDAKQFTGLEHCQARSETKLHFHFNTALTTVSLAKAIFYLDVPENERGSFSMADVKTQFFNELMLDKMQNLIFDECGINPNKANIKAMQIVRAKIINLGKINLRRA